MSAVWLVVRAGLRSRWRSWLALAVVAGLAGGLVTAVAAGARRTDAAYPALVTWTAPPDDIVTAGAGYGPAFASVTAAQVRTLPQVAAAGELDGFTALAPAKITVAAPVDAAVPGGFWHRKLLAGTLPDPRRPDEVDVSFTVAQAEHLTVGGSLHVTMLGPGDKPVPLTFRVAGIDATAGEFPPQYGTGIDYVWATPAFARQYASRLPVITEVAVRLLRGGADVPALENEISRTASGKAVSDYPLSAQAGNTESTIHLQAVVLWLLAGVLALLGLIIVWQLLSRFAVLESAGFSGLRAVGMRPSQLVAAGLVRAALIGACGAVIAVLLAYAASPLFPVGLAAVAEPRPGLDADWPVLALGAAGVVVAVLGCVAWPTWRTVTAGSRPAAVAPRSRADVLALVRTARPVPAATGVRMALHRGTGHTAVPVASTVAASVVGVLGLAAALVFTASLGSLLATPRDYGTDWDAVVSDLANGGSLETAARSVAADAAVAQWTGSYSFIPVPLEVNGLSVGGVTAGPGPDGSLAAAPRAGSPPATAGEIVLGQRTLQTLHARIGDTVSVSVAGLPKRVPLRVTGTAVFPAFGDATQLGTGAELTVAGLNGLVPAGVQLPPFTGILVKFRPGINPAAGVSALSARVGRLGPFAVTPPDTPADLVNFGELEDLPLLIGLALGGLALLTVAHLLLTGVPRHRRDLAVLRALGFTGGQVRATVSWMAVTMAVVALTFGVPLGIACGRFAWLLFAGQLGIQPVLVLSPVSFTVLAAAGVILAVAVAAVPGLSASRARPAAVLRAE
ncbi:MAG TPA: FtsX-like permease family protein [Trebonia sp.]|nr:FtsX-like permease family protein [Trebonia sp.]